MKGIILAGGTGSRLYPLTMVTSKQLLPVYDKPMIYYPLSVLMKAGIRDILIISTPIDLPHMFRLLGDGSKYGINLSYKQQVSPNGLAEAFIIGEDFIGDEPCVMVLGDNIFYGDGPSKFLNEGIENSKKGIATIFGYFVDNPKRFGVVEIGEDNKILSIEEKPSNPKSNYAVAGLYFYPKGVSAKAKTIKPSQRGELEISSLNELFLKENKLVVIKLNEDYTWMDAGTYDNLNEASNFVKRIQEEKNINICCPEGLAYQNGWISRETLIEQGEIMKTTKYGQHLLNLAKK